ncbi:MAG: HAD hydrolase family protein, partial [Lactobacillus crispatus]|nr:HAD hydrolase family protein [Lactobacillus crispatus]
MIKLIATDMDGTWLTDQKDYDKELFLREFAEMQKQGIKFVVASGNQYANLMTRFPE